MSVVIPSLRGAIAVPEWAKNELWRKARVVPSLDLRFAESKSLVDAITGTNLIDFTRASSGTYVGSDGLIKTATTNEARFDHDPTTGESLGLLVEESRTNEVKQSQAFDTVAPPDQAWLPVGDGVTVTPNQTVAPDGTVTADLLTANEGANDKGIQDFITTSVAGTTYTVSVFAKAASSNFVRIHYEGGGGTAAFAVNLATGTQILAINTTDVSITPYLDGWYRISTTKTAVGSAGMAIRIVICNSDGTAPGATGSVYVWGAQFETGAFPTSYIPTSSSQGDRAADVVSVSGINFSSWYRQDEGTFLGSSFAPQGTVLFGTADTFDNTLYVTANPTFNISIRSGGQSSATLTAPVSRFATSSAAVTYKVNDFAAVSDGGAIQTDNLGPVPVNQLRLKIGSSPWSTGAGNDLNGTIRRLTYWQTRLSNETLQTITQ